MSQLDDWIEILEQAEIDQNQEALERILQVIEEDKNGKLAYYAAEVLGCFVEYPEAKKALIKIAHQGDSFARYLALESLFFFYQRDPDPQIQQVTFHALNDSDSLVVWEALENIGLIGWEEAIPLIKPFLSHKDSATRGFAAEALGRIGNKEMIPYLKKGLKQEKKDWTKLLFYQALYFLGEKKYLKQIIGMLKSFCYQTRCATANFLEEITNQQNFYQIYFALFSQLKESKPLWFLQR